MNKAGLRKQMAAVLAELSVAERARQSKQVFDRLIAHPKYKASKRLSIYLSTEKEIDTIPILKHALELDQKQCFIPHISKQTQVALNLSTRMIMVTIESMETYKSLGIDNYGIKVFPSSVVIGGQQVAASWKDGGLDLLLVPGVAFKGDGHRLGHGKGYYDEFLSEWASKQIPRPYTLGLALKEQIVKELPVTEQDFRLDEVIWVE